METTNTDETAHSTSTIKSIVKKEKDSKMEEIQMKYRNVLHNTNTTLLTHSETSLMSSTNNDFENLELLLENEKQHNKTKTWNKLDKTQRIQKLHSYAERYVKEHGLPIKEVKNLKIFFSHCLDDQKLTKTKEVIYDKEEREIVNIPSLAYHMTNHSFYLKNMDPKHVSTIKSLTPKRISEKNIESTLHT